MGKLKIGKSHSPKAEETERKKFEQIICCHLLSCSQISTFREYAYRSQYLLFSLMKICENNRVFEEFLKNVCLDFWKISKNVSGINSSFKKRNYLEPKELPTNKKCTWRMFWTKNSSFSKNIIFKDLKRENVLLNVSRRNPRSQELWDCLWSTKVNELFWF